MPAHQRPVDGTVMNHVRRTSVIKTVKWNCAEDLYD